MNPNGKEGEGASVYWFVSVDSFVETITNMLENAFGTFLIDAVIIENSFTESEREEIVEPVTDTEWYNFKKLSDGVWKIECTISMMDESFEEENRGQQSAAICIMAIIFSKVN